VSRRMLIAGNWKMNRGPEDADTLARELKSALSDVEAVDTLVAPPFVSIVGVVSRLQHTGTLVAGQDLHTEASGAFTGAVSGEMLRQAGCTHVLVGHSERRHVFGDSNEVVGGKVQAALAAGLVPILCLGETLEERDAGQVDAVVHGQLAAGLAGLHSDQVATLVLAYEPVWAIGTGRTASPEQAQEVHASIRTWLAENHPDYVAQQMRILYGGSVKPGNAAELLGQPDIDGALVGGAALDADSFTAIAKAAPL
jgi:triosephosphate isomerase